MAQAREENWTEVSQEFQGLQSYQVPDRDNRPQRNNPTSGTTSVRAEERPLHIRKEGPIRRNCILESGIYSPLRRHKTRSTGLLFFPAFQRPGEQQADQGTDQPASRMHRQ